ncbi:hypothetical protein FPV67DRAFT_1421416, partial [Lyophyllum atratum]
LSRTYLTAFASRVMIDIQANDRDIGLMCCNAVGMMEVLACEVIVQERMRNTQGDHLGMFHFGGSDPHPLIFRAETKIQVIDSAKIGAKMQQK